MGRTYFYYFFGMFIIVGFNSCITYPKVITDINSSSSDKILEASKILSRPDSYKMADSQQDALIDLLDFYPSLTAMPEPISIKELEGLSDFEIEKKQEEYEQALKGYNKNLKQDILDVARVRSVAVRLLGENPSLEIFELLLSMLLDSEEIVRTEAKKVINKATFDKINLITEFTLNDSLLSEVRMFLVNKIAQFSHRSSTYLIKLLAINDLEVRVYVAQILCKIYPTYHNDMLKMLVTSDSDIKREHGAFWLGHYISREGLIDTLNLIKDSNAEVVESATNAFNNFGSWIAPDILQILLSNQYEYARLLMIRKMADFRDERVMPYLKELMEQEDTISFESASSAIEFFGIRYEPYYNQLYKSHVDRVRLTALQLSKRYMSTSDYLLKQILILLNDNNKQIKEETYNLINQLFYKNEELISSIYHGSKEAKVKHNLQKMFLANGSVKFLLNDKGFFNENSLYDLINTISHDSWQKYLELIKSSKSQVRLQTIYSFYSTIAKYNKQKHKYDKLPLLSELASLIKISNDIKMMVLSYNSDIEYQKETFIKKKEFIRQKRIWQLSYNELHQKYQVWYKNYRDDNLNIIRTYNYIDKRDIKIANYILQKTNYSLDTAKSFVDLQIP